MILIFNNILIYNDILIYTHFPYDRITNILIIIFLYKTFQFSTFAVFILIYDMKYLSFVNDNIKVCSPPNILHKAIYPLLFYLFIVSYAGNIFSYQWLTWVLSFDCDMVS